MTLAICCFLVAVGNRRVFQQKKRESEWFFSDLISGRALVQLGGEVQTSTDKNHETEKHAFGLAA